MLERGLDCGVNSNTNFSFSRFYYVTQITRISLVSLTHTARKSLENQRSNAHDYDEYLTRASRSNTGTSFDTEARFRIRILNAAGASEWSELSENVFLTDGVLKEQKPPRATSYCVRNADITVQWPLRYSTIERRKQDVTALPAHTHQVEMLVTNGKRISEALEFLRPGMRIEIEWDEYGM